MSERIAVSLEVTANRSASDHCADFDMFAADCEAALTPALDTLKPGRRLSDSLNLPTAVPVHFELCVRARTNGAVSPDRIPLKVKVTALPPLLQGMRSAVVDEIGDELFREVRGVRLASRAAAAMGFTDAPPVPFELEFEPEPIETGFPVIEAGCVPGSKFSWQKGCSSWPW
jgi:hypothetical protein